MIKGKISQIFLSIQGEGLYLGEKQVFIRLFGCNLGCKFCDTRLDYFEERSSEDLLNRIKLYGSSFHSVSFTGGEPLLQKDFLKEILQLTQGSGLKNYLETNGTLFNELKEVIDYVDIIAMDVKLPSSTGLGHYWQEHRNFLEVASRREVFIKAVICSSTSKEDILKALSLIKEINPQAMLFLQPNSNGNELFLQDKAESLRNLALENGVTACVIPQMHKIVGVM
ncbi:MAG: 7-carboxy-7-deazaguanine synthase QueE [Candidatus Omnitrophota bacterium]|nr:MAG: 7-carboxy-7-deazaguanine synthase QueE [Candidatus Omnitrophota bacterium]